MHEAEARKEKKTQQLSSLLTKTAKKPRSTFCHYSPLQFAFCLYESTNFHIDTSKYLQI